MVSESVVCTHQCIAQLIAARGALLHSIQTATNTTLTIERGPQVRIDGATANGVIVARDTIVALRGEGASSSSVTGCAQADDAEGPDGRRLRHAAELCGAERSKQLAAADAAFAAGDAVEGHRLMAAARQLCLETQGLHADAARAILAHNNPVTATTSSGDTCNESSCPATGGTNADGGALALVLDVRGLFGNEAVDAVRCKLNAIAANQRCYRRCTSAANRIASDANGKDGVALCDDGSHRVACHSDALLPAAPAPSVLALDVVATSPSVVQALERYLTEEDGLIFTKLPRPLSNGASMFGDGSNAAASTIRVFLETLHDGRLSHGSTVGNHQDHPCGASSSDASPLDATRGGSLGGEVVDAEVGDGIGSSSLTGNGAHDGLQHNLTEGAAVDAPPLGPRGTAESDLRPEATSGIGRTQHSKAASVHCCVCM